MMICSDSEIVRTWFINTNRYFMKTIEFWVKSPNASKASYKLKQRIQKNEAIRLEKSDKSEILIQKRQPILHGDRRPPGLNIVNS